MRLPRTRPVPANLLNRRPVGGYVELASLKHPDRFRPQTAGRMPGETTAPTMPAPRCDSNQTPRGARDRKSAGAARESDAHTMRHGFEEGKQAVGLMPCVGKAHPMRVPGRHPLDRVVRSNQVMFQFQITFCR